MTETAPAIAHLPPLKHRFGEPKWVSANQSVSGRAQTERTCILCGAVKVTLHGTGETAGTCRAWRSSTYAGQVETSTAPPCVPNGIQ